MGSDTNSWFCWPRWYHNTYNLTLLNGETDVVQRLERGAFFNRLAGEPPPLVERSRFQAVQLPELVFLGNVVDFDDGHSG